MTLDRTSTVFGHGRLSRYVPLILCAGTILFLSTGEASMENTSRFIRPLLEFLFPSADEATLQAYHGVIRKLSHLGVYALLVITAARAFRRSSKDLLRKFWPIAAISVVLFIATIDEFNQSLNPVRTGTPADVMIDFAGGLLGLGMFYVVIRFIIRDSSKSV